MVDEALVSADGKFREVPKFIKDGAAYGTIIEGQKGIACIEHAERDQRKLAMAISELQGPDAKRFAQAIATKHLISDPRLQFSPAPYAVDADGDLVVNPTKQKVAAYRIDVEVTGRLV